MSAALRIDGNPAVDFERRRMPRVVLVGPPVLKRRHDDDEPLIVIGNWQDMTERLARACAGRNGPCGCARGNCANGQCPANPPGTSNVVLDPNTIDCNSPGWTAFTVANNLVVGANGTGSVSWSPQAPFTLARLTLSAAQAADFTGISIQVGDVQNILPSTVDGTYFSVASNQDGDGRVRAPKAMPGQQIVISFISAAGVAANAARFTLQGVYERTAWG